MDALFLETLEFNLLGLLFAQCCVAPSREEVLRNAMAEVGLELIDYGDWTHVYTLDNPPTMRVRVFSKAWRERAERQAYRHLT